MALTHTPPAELGMFAPSFSLPGTDGKLHSDRSTRRARGLLVVFMCNHCPYVQAIRSRLVRISELCERLQIGMVGISSNDATRYPEDSFEKMKEEVSRYRYSFPYLFDETQEVARAYGAVCTPDFFLFGLFGAASDELKLVYRGRLDDSWKDESKVTSRDLEESLHLLSQGAPIPQDQKYSMGCSIKWKT